MSEHDYISKSMSLLVCVKEYILHESKTFTLIPSVLKKISFNININFVHKLVVFGILYQMII